MALTKELILAIKQMQDSGLEERVTEVHEWLKYERKETMSEVITFVGLQDALIENLTRELADLRKEKREPEQVFFPFSKTARKRY